MVWHFGVEELLLFLRDTDGVPLLVVLEAYAQILFDCGHFNDADGLVVHLFFGLQLS